MQFRYRRPFILSARQDERSGRLNGNIVPLTRWPDSESTVIMLVHGFNTDLKEANEGYFNLLDNMRKSGMPDYILPRVCQFYWPGNLSNIFSRPSYFIQVKKATAVAGMLSAYLAKLPMRSRTQLIFIGHSLGCRLILETLQLILLQPVGNRVGIKSIQLMAAAVPVPMVSKGGSLFNLASSGQSISGIYSTKDSVLKTWFPLGQWAAREGYSEAVGLRGNPAHLWSEKPDPSQNDHNDYWEDKAAAGFLVKKLGIPSKPAFPKNRISVNSTNIYKLSNTRSLKKRTVL